VPSTSLEGERVDDSIKSFTVPSIFGRLSDAGKTWAIYGYDQDPYTIHDFPDTQKADDSQFGQYA
jgi:phospholipase C